jgi:uncharacterized protein
MNLLKDLSRESFDARSLKWDHPPRRWEPLPKEGVRVFVPPRVDYFQDPAGVNTKDNAPFLWVGVSGDFTARARVRPSFAAVWDAGAIMARGDETHWAKLCYESTDLGTTAVVSVVTNGVSDDANGVDLTVPDVWLQISRAGEMIGMHYGLEERGLRMVRVFRLSMPSAVQVGLVAQCPVGPGTTVDFHSFEIEPRTVKDLRVGV